MLLSLAAAPRRWTSTGENLTWWTESTPHWNVRVGTLRLDSGQTKDLNSEWIYIDDIQEEPFQLSWFDTIMSPSPEDVAISIDKFSCCFFHLPTSYFHLPASASPQMCRLSTSGKLLRLGCVAQTWNLNKHIKSQYPYWTFYTFCFHVYSRPEVKKDLDGILGSKEMHVWP